MIRRHNTAQQKVIRGRIILLSSQGQDNSTIARMLKVTIDMVRLWRKRWADLQPIELKDLSIEASLEDLPRPGTPAQLTADQICQFES